MAAVDPTTSGTIAKVSSRHVANLPHHRMTHSTGSAGRNRTGPSPARAGAGGAEARPWLASRSPAISAGRRGVAVSATRRADSISGQSRGAPLALIDSPASRNVPPLPYSSGRSCRRAAPALTRRGPAPTSGARDDGVVSDVEVPDPSRFADRDLAELMVQVSSRPVETDVAALRQGAAQRALVRAKGPELSDTRDVVGPSAAGIPALAARLYRPQAGPAPVRARRRQIRSWVSRLPMVEPPPWAYTTRVRSRGAVGGLPVGA